MQYWGKLVGGVLVVMMLAGAIDYWRRNIREPHISTGPLAEALAAAAKTREDADLSAVFFRFIPDNLPLEQRRDILVSNGFSCEITPSRLVKGNRILSCLRPNPGSGFCRGFSYYSYGTSEGGFLDTSGSGFRGTADTPFGQCARNRAQFLSQREE